MFEFDTDFPLRVRYQYQEVTPAHTHEFVEVIIILAGSGTHQTKFAKYHISAGDVIVIPKNGIHGYLEVHDLELMNVLFDPLQLPLPLMDLSKLPGYNALFVLDNDFFEQHRFYPKFHLNKENSAIINTLLTEMRRESETRIPGYRCCQMGYFMALLGNLCRLYSENLESIHESSLNIGKVISYLNSNYQKDICLADILHKIAMSKSTFLRNFRRAIGTTPIDYLIQIRVARASYLLQESDLSISEVGYRVGFTDSNYFSRTFRKITGQTPREFRKDNEVK